MKIEANYRSNIDFNATRKKVEKRIGCEVELIRSPDSEAEYGISIKRISPVEGAALTISAKGTLQIFCKHERLNDCIKWILEVVELLPGHKRLVLFPTKITYSIHDTHKEAGRPTDEVIDRIAKADGTQSMVILPIGWVHKFFVELPENPLQKFFPDRRPLENYVIEEEKRKKDAAMFPAKSGTESKQFLDLQYPPTGWERHSILGCKPTHNSIKWSDRRPFYRI